MLPLGSFVLSEQWQLDDSVSELPHFKAIGVMSTSCATTFTAFAAVSEGTTAVDCKIVEHAKVVNVASKNKPSLEGCVRACVVLLCERAGQLTGVPNCGRSDA